MKTITTSQKLICGIALLGTTLLISCGTNRKVKVAELPKAKTIEILAVNDMHAAIDTSPGLPLWLTVCGIYTPTYCLFRGDNQTGNRNDQYPEKGIPIVS